MLEEESITIDHILPKSRGGKNTFENTVASCFKCKNKKGDRTPREASMSLNTRPVQPTVMEFLLKFHNSLGAKQLMKKFWDTMKNEI